MQMSVSRLCILFHWSICVLLLLFWLCSVPEYLVDSSCALQSYTYMSDSVYYDRHTILHAQLPTDDFKLPCREDEG